MVECEYKFQRKNGANEHSFNRYMVECESKKNVNIYLKLLRFNRYMVECECVHKLDYSWRITVLIDTWWNVNYYSGCKDCTMPIVLIDTWWNVN